MGGKGLSGEQVGSKREEYAALLYTDAQKKDGEVMHEIPRVFLSYPIHNPLVKWEKDEDGLITLIYKKNFGKFERWLHSKIGGPEEVRRPLDEQGSRMWLLMDGDHTILDMCIIMDKEYKEAMAPVLKKVRLFLERLLILNLVVLLPPKDGEKAENDEAGSEEESEDECDEEEDDGENSGGSEKDKVGDGNEGDGEHGGESEKE